MVGYKVIFDTNILFMGYNGDDFNKFDFGASLKNIINKIREYNLEEIVEITVPEIVWLEIKQHRKEKYYEIYRELKNKYERYSLPGIKIEINDIDNSTYFDKVLEKTLKDYIEENKVVFDVPIVISKDSIVNRVINKYPPFEGKEKESDKGFKDTLLWESILDYKRNYREKKIIMYTNDKIFHKELLKKSIWICLMRIFT